MPVDQSTTGSTSSDLLTRVRSRDREAWSRFAALYAPLVYQWCRRAGIRPDDAADVMQEVFAAVFTAIVNFRRERPGDSLRGWMYTICRNKVRDLQRKADAPQAVGGTDANAKMAEVVFSDDNEATSSTDRHGLVRRAAQLVRGEFEQRTWQAFWLVAVEHRTAAEAGEQLGMSASAVRQAKYIVLRRLREELSGDVE